MQQKDLTTMNNLQLKFNKEIAGQLQKELKLENIMAVPHLSKIVVNMGVKDATADKKNMEKSLEILAQIAGQKPKYARAKKSISAFKLREGDKIGLVVTLRGTKMYDFFERLTSIVMPRFRDFHGVRKNSYLDPCAFNLQKGSGKEGDRVSVPLR